MHRRHLADIWQRLGGSLWFVPAVIVLASVALAIGMIDLSGNVQAKVLDRFPRLFGADAASSRSMLAAIAGSLITVAGVSFSIVVVAVTQASNQYTPRILRNFMNDRRSQVTLGVLVGAFVYCLVVLRTIREYDELSIPSLAVLGAFVVAIIAIGHFVYFIHHTAGSLEVGRIIERVSIETMAAVHAVFPEDSGASPEADEDLPDLPNTSWHAVRATHTGYIQSIDADGLLELAERRDVTIRMERGVGDFVARDTLLASVSPRGPDHELTERLNDLYTARSYRTVTQDPAFGLRQLVDIALRALSPGVNDSTTAVTCIHYIGAILVQLAARGDASARRLADGKVRVLLRMQRFEQLLALAFDEIRCNAGGSAAVLQAILAALQDAGRNTRSQRRQAILARHARHVLEQAQHAIRTQHDREEVVRAYERATRSIEARSANLPPLH